MTAHGRASMLLALWGQEVAQTALFAALRGGVDVGFPAAWAALKYLDTARRELGAALAVRAADAQLRATALALVGQVDELVQRARGASTSPDEQAALNRAVMALAAARRELRGTGA